MRAISSIISAFSMFSQIPMPRIEWREDSMRYMMCAFPLVGLVVGLLLFAWCHVGMMFGMSALVFATGLTVIPLLLTGGIHLDGFCDVVDALSSHAEPERKRAILKDPHIGAFAAIGIGCYLLVFLACASEVPMTVRAALALLVIPVLGRCCSGITLLVFPRSASQGLLSMFKESASKRVTLGILVVELVACLCVIGFLSLPLLGAIAVVLALCTGVLHHIAMAEFGGMSGDLSGFYLQLCELAMLFCLALLGGFSWF